MAASVAGPGRRAQLGRVGNAPDCLRIRATQLRNMKSRVVVAGHAIHPILVAFPLGLLATSVAWDICRLVTGHPSWGAISFWTILAGVIGALVAAVPGFIDWLGIPRGTRARAVGLS